MREIWKDIKGYEGLYQVSNNGNIRACKKVDLRGWNRKERSMSAQISDHGYYSIILHKDYIKRSFLVHRLVAEAFIENPNEYPVINHKDEDQLNNNMDNLEWCTQKYNVNYGTSQARRIAKRYKQELVS